MIAEPAVTITEADETHLEALAAFFWEGWRQAGPDAPGWAGASEEVIEHLADPDMLKARMGGPERRMYLAWEDGRVVGFAATRALDDRHVELAGIVVLQDMVGRGVGTPLLETAVAAARDAGFRTMLVRTEADNDRAAGFYRSRGFGAERRLTERIEGRDLALLQLEMSLEG